MIAASSAHADGIVLEAYTGERPADASRLVSPILDELAKNKFTSGDTLARQYAAAVSQPAQSPEGLPPDFSEQVERGFRSWVAGKFDEAIKQLVPLIESAHANTGAFARAPTLREPLRKAMIPLALSQMRTGDPGAMHSTFFELLRGFPDAQVSRGTYGSEAYEAFEQVRRDVTAAGHGKLTVKVTDDKAVVFVDEAYRAIGTTSMELPPGDYRVVAVLNAQPSRSHHVTVRAGAEVTVVVDAAFDQSVHTGDWTGFQFAAEATRDGHEATYAAELAKAIGARSVAVVGIDQVKGHTAIVGALVSLESGREIRRASIALDPDPSNDRLKALARFLAGEEPAAGLEVQFGSDKDSETVATGGGGRPIEPTQRWGGWKWITAVAAVGGLTAGGVLLALDGKCKQTPDPGRPCNDVYANSPGQWVGLGVGAVFAGVSIYLFATQHDRPSRTAYITPTPNGAIAGYATSW